MLDFRVIGLWKYFASNVEIAQLYYHTIDGDYEEYNSGKYQNNTDIQPSMLYKDFLK